VPIEGAYHYAPALGDLDGDGFDELVLGTWQAGILVYRNRGGSGRGSNRWDNEPMARLELTRGSKPTPALADPDGDGDLDLVAGESSGEVNVWRNEGSGNATTFRLVTDRLEGIDAGRRSRPAVHDWDGDGHADLILGSESAGITLWTNVSRSGEIRFESAGILLAEAPTFAAPAVADADGDGDLDLFVGGIGGGIVLYERIGPVSR
jgi:hypothetical protein